MVIPIFKKGDTTNLSNYRPISLLPVMSKLFEKVLNKQITQVLDINGYIDDEQYGFRMHHSTEDAIVKLVDTIEKGLGENKTCSVYFVDVSKAFDSCNHNIILAKMEQTGLNEQGISIMRLYLKDRVQMVQVNGINGGEFIINIGVEQGAILKIYIMDLHKVTTLSCIKFADNSKFMGIANTLNTTGKNGKHRTIKDI
jgi:retron-type reverse transcriptase